jgi:pimeloyl-ACP methyl ester carboxylesterase
MTARHTAILALLALAILARAEKDGPLDNAESRFANHDGNRVHYKSLGKGTRALVFVHGWTCDLTAWRAQAGALKEVPRSLFIDLPGHGKSGRPQKELTMALFARAVEAVLRDAGVEKAVLVGHSMGTPVVREFYRLFPEKTAALVHVDGPLRPFFAGRAKDREAFIERLSGPESDKAREEMINRMFGKDASDELRKEVKGVMLQTPKPVAVSAMKAILDPSIWKEDAIKVPVLVVVTRAPQWEGYEPFVRKFVPELEYRVMDDVGHFLMLEKPEAFNKLLASFLKGRKLLGEGNR